MIVAVPTDSRQGLRQRGAELGLMSREQPARKKGLTRILVTRYLVTRRLVMKKGKAMHPMHPSLANDSMRARTAELCPTSPLRRRRLTAARPTERPLATHPGTQLRAWAGWHLVRVGLRLAVSPR
jgi:hypothetical protein